MPARMLPRRCKRAGLRLYWAVGVEVEHVGDEIGRAGLDDGLGVADSSSLEKPGRPLPLNPAFPGLALTSVKTQRKLPLPPPAASAASTPRARRRSDVAEEVGRKLTPGSPRSADRCAAARSASPARPRLHRQHRPRRMVDDVADPIAAAFGRAQLRTFHEHHPLHGCDGDSASMISLSTVCATSATAPSRGAARLSTRW